MAIIFRDNRAEAGGHEYQIQKFTTTTKGKTESYFVMKVYRKGREVLSYQDRSVGRLKNIAFSHYLKEKPKVKDFTNHYRLGQALAMEMFTIKQ